MADYIDRQAVIDALDRTCDLVCQYSKKQRYAMCGACPLGSAFDAVENVPSVDAVEVVRCWNCIWWDDCPSSTIAPTFHRCKRVGRMGTEANDFCSFGERKDE